MLKKLPYIPLFVSLLILSCEKQTSWETQVSEQFLVVDCIITNENKYHELKIYQSANSFNQLPTPISGAIVELSNGRNSVQFKEDSNLPGTYFSEIPFRASAGNNYRLSINYNGIFDTAFAQMTTITPSDAFEIVAADSLYRFNYQSSQSPSMTEVFYDWSVNPEYCNYYGACKASETFYTLDNIDMSKLLAPEKEIISFPRKTQIIRKKYSLSSEHQEFIRSLLFETEWRGGLFEVEQGNVPTNFHQSVKGWFAACMVLSDTTFFD